MSGPEGAPIVISSSPSSSDDTSGGAPNRSHGSRLRSRLRSSKKTENGECEEKEEEGGEVEGNVKGEEEKKEEDEVEGNVKGEEEKKEEEGEEVEGNVKGEEANGVRKRSPPSASDVVFPTRRVKFLMTECEECRPSHESIFLVNKAVQFFLEAFVSDVYRKGHKTVTYRNLSSAVSVKKKYQFLSDYVPEKIKAEDALNARASLE